ncbi:GNAT family N-acetyltransferase [Streptacidiphilus jiangxiensis]|uniref:Protein N-acetyltransferase, RimJ/RimL family n=1 Tax=Streptacidiphilus jiangxiensis TaxID=235985 RepID=A0A1H7SRV2_STRJI|nr:GNAT family N-acetyltransferase [Streptacidiphilus jiangxiensis]SEL74786.1 Protein N-acetyltransferase, RimJ/RimL family [Streptacidiphilus jiangxiensis]
MEHGAEEILTHERVVLTRWRGDQLDELTLLVDGALERLKPFMPWARTHSREGIASYLAQADADWASGAAYNYAIREGAVDAPVLGSCSMMARIGEGGWEIGYWIHQGGGGRGLVTMAAAALTRQAFALPGTTRVEIHHDALNHASGAVPARLGFAEVERRADPEPGRETVVWRMECQAAADSSG